MRERGKKRGEGVNADHSSEVGQHHVFVPGTGDWGPEQPGMRGIGSWGKGTFHAVLMGWKVIQPGALSLRPES